MFIYHASLFDPVVKLNYSTENKNGTKHTDNQTNKLTSSEECTDGKTVTYSCNGIKQQEYEHYGFVTIVYYSSMVFPNLK